MVLLQWHHISIHLRWSVYYQETYPLVTLEYFKHWNLFLMKMKKIKQPRFFFFFFLIWEDLQPVWLAILGIKMNFFLMSCVSEIWNNHVKWITDSLNSNHYLLPSPLDEMKKTLTLFYSFSSSFFIQEESLLVLTLLKEQRDQDVVIQVLDWTVSQPFAQNNTKVSVNVLKPSPVPTVVPFPEMLLKQELYVHF